MTLVDLFAAQALLPALVREYDVSPATIKVAIYAGTFGMAAAGIAIALLGARIDRRRGVVLSLAILVIPTALLATMAPLPVLAGLRVARHGPARAASLGLVAAVARAPLLLVGQLQAVLIGLALVGAGTFFAQAVATGGVGRLADTSRAAAGALGLAAYYLGGLAGSAVIGRLSVEAGWPAAVAGIGLALLLAIPLVRTLGGQLESSG